MRYFDELDNLTTGKYEGENVYEVAEEDSEYLTHLLNDCSPGPEDREILQIALGLPIDEVE
jgi:hypothetical protein